MSLSVYLMDNACGSCGHQTELFTSNITHNLVDMAIAANIYQFVWRPDENGITKASQLIQPLIGAIQEMFKDPERFKKHDAENGWGTYNHFLPWLQQYLLACIDNPDANVEVSR